MPVREVIRMGHPTLRRVADEVDPATIKGEEIQSLIQDLFDTCAVQKGLGIAAPQINVPKQVFIVEVPEYNERYGKLIPFPKTVVINPKITVLDEQTQGFWEGCLSVPGLKGYVRRPRKIRLEYYDEKGEQKSVEAEKLGAVVIQHEADHVFGKLFVDRAEPGKLAFLEEFEHFKLAGTEPVLDD